MNERNDFIFATAFILSPTPIAPDGPWEERNLQCNGRDFDSPGMDSQKN